MKVEAAPAQLVEELDGVDLLVGRAGAT